MHLHLFSPDAATVPLKPLAHVAGLLAGDHEPPFAAGPPEGLDPGWLSADVELASEIACERCGHQGGAFAAFSLAGRYEAYSCCHTCGHCTLL